MSPRRISERSQSALRIRQIGTQAHRLSPLRFRTCVIVLHVEGKSR